MRGRTLAFVGAPQYVVRDGGDHVVGDFKRAVAEMGDKLLGGAILRFVEGAAGCEGQVCGERQAVVFERGFMADTGVAVSQEAYRGLERRVAFDAVTLWTLSMEE